nr:MAG TPA: hypothetical protein [Caudoviricetes sp.]
MISYTPVSFYLGLQISELIDYAEMVKELQSY